MNSNTLTGTIPDELYDCTRLQVLALWGNRLTGTVSPLIGRLVDGRQDHRSERHRTLWQPSFRAVPLRDLSRLEWLEVSDLPHLHGGIPPFSRSTSALRVLVLGHSNLQGTLPDMGNASALQVLVLSNNELGGSLPASLASCRNLTAVLLGSSEVALPMINASSAGASTHGVGVCGQGELSVLTGNAIECEGVPELLRRKDSGGLTYECVAPGLPARVQQALALCTGMLVVCGIVARLHGAAVPQRQVPPRVAAFMRHSVWGLGTAAALGVAAAGAALANGWAASVRQCQPPLQRWSLTGVRYDIGAPVAESATPPGVLVAPAVLALLAWSGCSAARLSSPSPGPGAVRATAGAVGSDAGPPASRWYRTRLVAGIAGLITISAAPNAVYVAVTGSPTASAATKAAATTAVALSKSAINAGVVPWVSRVLLLRKAVSQRRVRPFGAAFWLTLCLRVVNSVVVPLGVVLALDSRCLYGAWSPGPQGNVTVGAEYCAVTNTSGTGTCCSRSLGVVAGACLRKASRQPTARVDLDCAALVFGSAGVVVDAAFYNRVVAADGALHHSGDSTPEESGVSVNESIDVDVDQLPWSVAGVVFVADAYAGGTLGDVKSATTLVQTADGDGGHDTPFKTNVDFGGRSVGTDAKGVVLAVLHRNPEDVNEWLLKKVGTMCAGPLAHTFEGCLEEARDAVAKKREEREEDVKCSQ